VSEANYHINIGFRQRHGEGPSVAGELNRRIGVCEDVSIWNAIPVPSLLCVSFYLISVTKLCDMIIRLCMCDETIKWGWARWWLIELSIVQREKRIDIYREKEIVSITKSESTRESTKRKHYSESINQTRGLWGNSFRTKPEDGGGIAPTRSPRMAGKESRHQTWGWPGNRLRSKPKCGGNIVSVRSPRSLVHILVPMACRLNPSVNNVQGSDKPCQYARH